MIAEDRYGLVTLHRPANVDNEQQFSEIRTALERISEKFPSTGRPSRTRTKLEAGAALGKDIHLLDPLGYLDFLSLQAQSSVVLTDSGGIQEETTVLGVPCLTLRENTERPVTVDCGTNRLAGTSAASIWEAWRQSVAEPKSGRVPPLWDGQAGERSRAVLRQYFLAAAGAQ